MSEESPRSETDAPDATEGTDSPSGDPAVIGADALVAQLVEADILLDDRERDDLRLTDGFREDLWGRIEQFHEEGHARNRLASVADIDPAGLTLAETDDRFVAFHEGTELGAWPSRAAFVADLALQPTMAEWLPLFERIDPLSRGELLARIRGFLETCPACQGSLEIEDRTDAGTGRGEVSITCVDCGQVMVRGTL